jgi:hypothetical protein
MDSNPANSTTLDYVFFLFLTRLAGRFFSSLIVLPFFPFVPFHSLSLPVGRARKRKEKKGEGEKLNTSSTGMLRGWSTTL